jgi:Zn-dependent protease
VFLLEPNETAWDLRWRMFGIPVRVHPMFWLLAALLGGHTLRMGVQYLLMWIACVFISILIHELGHVVMGMFFGTQGRIVLYSFGGIAIGSNQLDRRWQRILVSAAGPVAGFLFLGIILGALWARNPEVLRGYLLIFGAELGVPVARDDPELLTSFLHIGQHFTEFFVVRALFFINLVWGLLNLLPVWPLDGGQISRDVCQGVSPSGGLKFSLGISLLIAGLLCLHCILGLNGKQFLPLPVGGLYMALFFGMFALQSFQLLQQAHAEEQWARRHWDEDDHG